MAFILLSCTPESIVYVKKVKEKEPHLQPYSSHFKLKFENLGFMSDTNIWLLQCPNPKENLANLKLKFDSRVYVANVTLEQEVTLIEIREVYRVSDPMTIHKNIVGLWMRSPGLVWTEKSIWERRRDLEGYTPTCGTAHVSYIVRHCQIQQKQSQWNGFRIHHL